MNKVLAPHLIKPSRSPRQGSGGALSLEGKMGDERIDTPRQGLRRRLPGPPLEKHRPQETGDVSHLISSDSEADSGKEGGGLLPRSWAQRLSRMSVGKLNKAPVVESKAVTGKDIFVVVRGREGLTGRYGSLTTR